MKKYTVENNRFYQRKAWKACRESYIGKRILIDGGLCEICEDRIGKEVDHIIELNEHNVNDPEISLNHDNLQYLCKECHNMKTFGNTNRGVFFDENGEPIFKEIKK